AAPDTFAVALVHATGSAAHVSRLREQAERQGLELREDGLYRAGSRVPTPAEEDVYRLLGLAFVEPELREDGSEVAAARAGSLPELVTYDDLRGCFHCHTTYSD